jgi:hypothetical protein
MITCGISLYCIARMTNMFPVARDTRHRDTIAVRIANRSAIPITRVVFLGVGHVVPIVLRVVGDTLTEESVTTVPCSYIATRECSVVEVHFENGTVVSSCMGSVIVPDTAVVGNVLLEVLADKVIVKKHFFDML